MLSRWSLFYQRCYNKKGEKEKERRGKEIISSFLPHPHLLYPFTWILVVHANLITFSLPFLLAVVLLFIPVSFVCVLLFRSFYVTLILVRLLGFLMLHSIYHLFYIIPLHSLVSLLLFLTFAPLLLSLTRVHSLDFFTLIRHQHTTDSTPPLPSVDDNVQSLLPIVFPIYVCLRKGFWGNGWWNGRWWCWWCAAFVCFSQNHRANFLPPQTLLHQNAQTGF